ITSRMNARRVRASIARSSGAPPRIGAQCVWARAFPLTTRRATAHAHANLFFTRSSVSYWAWDGRHRNRSDSRARSRTASRRGLLPRDVPRTLDVDGLVAWSSACGAYGDLLLAARGDFLGASSRDFRRSVASLRWRQRGPASD